MGHTETPPMELEIVGATPYRMLMLQVPEDMPDAVITLRMFSRNAPDLPWNEIASDLRRERAIDLARTLLRAVNRDAPERIGMLAVSESQVDPLRAAIDVAIEGGNDLIALCNVRANLDEISG